MGIKSILLFVSMAAISYNQITMVTADASPIVTQKTNSGLEKIEILKTLNTMDCGTTGKTCCDQFIAKYKGTDGDNDKITVLCKALNNLANDDFKSCPKGDSTAINKACNNLKADTIPINKEPSEKGKCLKSAFDKVNNIGSNCQKEHHTELKDLIYENKTFSHCENIKTKVFNNKCNIEEKTKLTKAVCKLTETAEADKKKPIDNIMKSANTTNCRFLVTGAMTTWYDIENICKTVKSTQQADFKMNCPKAGEYDKVKDAACSLKFESCSGGANAVFSGLLTIFVSLVAVLFTKS